MGAGKGHSLGIPHLVPLLPLHTSLIHSELPLSASYAGSDPLLAPRRLWAGVPARAQSTWKASTGHALQPPSIPLSFPPPDTLYSLSRQGSHTVWLAPQGWATPSPRLQALQHSPLRVYRPVGHTSLASPRDTWVEEDQKVRLARERGQGRLPGSKHPLLQPSIGTTWAGMSSPGRHLALES